MKLIACVLMLAIGFAGGRVYERIAVPPPVPLPTLLVELPQSSDGSFTLYTDVTYWVVYKGRDK